MSQTSNNTLGFFLWTVALTIVFWLATVAAKAYRLREDEKGHAIRRAFRDSLTEGLFIAVGMIGLVIVAWGIAVIRTIFNDHMRLVATNQQLIAERHELQQDLAVHRHSIVTTDPVFPNIIYMLQSFEKFKRDMDAPPSTPGQSYCVLYVSYPKESESLAMLMVQLGGPLTGCFAIGVEANPELDQELLKGMNNDAIKVHAVEGERAADGLFSTLGNQIRLERSYRMFNHPEKRWSPYSPMQHVVWLQFGKNVKWNSELPR